MRSRWFRGRRSNVKRYPEVIESIPMLIDSPFPTVTETPFSLGVGLNGSVDWTPFHQPNLVVFGESKSGKTTFLKNVAAQAISSGWNVNIITDNKDNVYEWSEVPVHKVVSDTLPTLKLLLDLHELLLSRHTLVEESRANVYLDLSEDITPILIAIDGLDAFFAHKQNSFDFLNVEGGIFDLTHRLLETFVRFGKTVGIFVVSSTDSTDCLYGELMQNFNSEVRLGGYKPAVSAYKGLDAPVISNTLGRALIILHGQLIETQTYCPPFLIR